MITNELLDRFAEAVIQAYKQDHITEGNQAVNDIGDNCDDCIDANEGGEYGENSSEWCERHSEYLPGLLVDEPSGDDKDLAKLALAEARKDLVEEICERRGYYL